LDAAGHAPQPLTGGPGIAELAVARQSLGKRFPHTLELGMYGLQVQLINGGAQSDRPQLRGRTAGISRDSSPSHLCR